MINLFCYWDAEHFGALCEALTNLFCENVNTFLLIFMRDVTQRKKGVSIFWRAVINFH